MFLLYSLLLTIGFILMLPLFFLRRNKYAEGFRQRLGHIPGLKQNTKPVVWIHCVSVGETNAAAPLVKSIRENFPDYRIVVSTTTKTGQELAHKIFADDAEKIFYFPFDWKFTVRRALSRIKPNLVLLMETEIWFNFIREAGKSGARVFIVNGRLSEKSAKNYQKIPKTMTRVLHYVDFALVQTKLDAVRFAKIGISKHKISVTGNIKFDQQPLSERDVFGAYFGDRFEISSKNPLIVAASTHAPEEKWILEAFKEVYKNNSQNLPRLLIAPRHPERFDEVAELIRQTGLKLIKRSDPISNEDLTADVILMDSIGELRSIFPLAQIVFIGGSLIPHGGQNILEPALAKKAVVTGFYTTNFKEIVQTFENNNAVIHLPELSESEIVPKLTEIFGELLENSEKRRKLGENAFRVLKENRGATEKTLKRLRTFFQVQNENTFSPDSSETANETEKRFTAQTN